MKITGRAGTLSTTQAGNMSTITVNMDIETTPCVLGNVTGGILPHEMFLISAGNQTGKSMLSLKVFKNRYYGATERTFWAPSNLCKEIMFPEPSKPKYQFSRAKWYTAPLNGNGTWRFSDEYNEIIEWCTEMFGAHPTKQDAWSRWYVGLGFINFRDAKDYEWYILRWS